MNDDLLGYLWNLDDPDERRHVEERLRTDPEAARTIEQLRWIGDTLEADKEPPAAPAGLAARTIGRVAEHICHQAATPQPREPAVQDRMTPDRWKNVIEVLDRAGTPTRSRRADWIVAGSIVVIAVGLLLAGIPYLRHRNNVQACQNQLRQMYQALEIYADSHEGKYPKVGEKPPYETAGSFLAILHDSGSLPASSEFSCPAARPLYPASYAYSLGYRDDNGQLVGLTRGSASGNDALAILADRPAPERTGPNPDHRYGQNVLFLGGNVRFCTTTQAGLDGDDIYHNRQGLVAAGLDIRDTSLGVAADRP